MSETPVVNNTDNTNNTGNTGNAGNTGNTDFRSVSAQWPVKDIVYVSIVGTVMIAALLEWILWLLSFLYCLAKVFRKADGKGKWVVRILAVVNMLFFIAMRVIFLPVMIVTLPLPSQIEQVFPHGAVVVLQMFAFYSFAGLLVVPWLFCVFSQVTHHVGRRRRVKTVLDDYSAPKMVIVMPCYNEEPGVLLRTIDSIVECDYPRACMHVFLSFDGDAENELYLNTIEKLGVPLTLAHYPKSIDVTYHDSRITVSRFPHGGKRSCQKRTFKLIDKIYAEYLRRNDNLFLLFIDSDCILDKVCIQNFMYEMELKPGSKRNVLAMTGVITSTTVKHSLLTLLQDMEYIHGQLFERSVESACGAVTCLPGALTCLRFSAFRRVARYYFADKVEQCNDMFDYGKCHLGEDRWLTHLFMIGAKERYQIQMNTGAFCKTEAVQTFKSLLKQRRRWFLGFITNEACMVTDIRLYKRYPLLCVMRLASNTIRTTALLFFIMVISLMSTEEKIKNLPVGFIGVSLGLNWLLMLYFGAKLGRYKIMMYPLMFVINPFMNWLYMVYGIFTAGQRTWGGPRADAGKADVHTTPAEAVERAAKDGDEFNVAPETFKPAIEAATHRLPHQAPLLPSGHLEGRFAPAEELPGGWFRQANDSGTLYADMTPREYEGVLYGKTTRRDSLDSSQSDLSLGSLYHPRRVESIFAESQGL
ncbi:glycosyltransferase family 2 protein, partial [Acidomyces richmondensis BFW]